MNLPADSVCQRPLQTRSSPELRMVLLILSHRDRLQNLINHVISPAVWESVSAALRQRLFEDFAMLGEINFDILKNQYLDAASPDQLEVAKSLVITLELKFNQIATLFKQDQGMTLSHAIHLLAICHPENAEHEKLISQHWQHSPDSQKYANHPNE